MKIPALIDDSRSSEVAINRADLRNPTPGNPAVIKATGDVVGIRIRGPSEHAYPVDNHHNIG